MFPVLSLDCHLTVLEALVDILKKLIKINQIKKKKEGVLIDLDGSSMHVLNEEPAKLNRDVALRAVRPNSLFSKVIFS
jgi:hypothetical protein